MIIQHNLQAANAKRILGQVTARQSNTTKKLSSGYKINSAADDAAGLSISEKMRTQIRGLHKASHNTQDGISLIQVAEGALNEIHSILQRMNELATQAANDTNTSVDRDTIKSEIDQLAKEIDRSARTTQFNSMNLLDGSFKNKNIQAGANAGQLIHVDIKAMDTHALGLALVFDNPNTIDIILQSKPSIQYIEQFSELDTAYNTWQSFDVATGRKNLYNPEQNLFVNSYEMAGRTMKLVQNSIELVSEMRASLGAVQNRLEHTTAILDNTAENLTDSESKIRDADMAQEMVAYSINSILMQAGQSMLVQANQNSQSVLSLFR